MFLRTKWGSSICSRSSQIRTFGWRASFVLCVFSHLQSRDDISIRWDLGLKHKRMAYFFFPKDKSERLDDVLLLLRVCVCVCLSICSHVTTSPFAGTGAWIISAWPTSSFQRTTWTCAWCLVRSWSGQDHILLWSHMVTSVVWLRSHTAMVTHGHGRGLVKITSQSWSGQGHILLWSHMVTSVVWLRSHTAAVTHGHGRGLVKITSQSWSGQGHILLWSHMVTAVVWSRSHTALVTHGHVRGLIKVTYCCGHTWSQPWSSQDHILLWSHMVKAVVWSRSLTAMVTHSHGRGLVKITSHHRHTSNMKKEKKKRTQIV